MDEKSLDDLNSVEPIAPSLDSLTDASPPKTTPPIDLEQHSVSEASSALLRLLQYSSSFSEKTIRSAGAIAGGIVRESSNWRVPSAFLNSKSYSNYVQQLLGFVTRDFSTIKIPLIATRDNQVSPREKQAQATVFLARNTVSNLLDMTALATFHLSPLTVISIFSNLAYGSSLFLRELTDRLQHQGIVEPNAEIHSASDLLSSLELATNNAEGVFEKPPISVAGIRRTTQQLEQAIEAKDPHSILPFSELDQLWRQIELAARVESVSISDISATISVVALDGMTEKRDDFPPTLDFLGDIVAQQIFSYYWIGLREIEKNGLIATLSRASEPFLEDIWTNYSMHRKNWTDQLLSGELLKWGWSRLSWPALGLPSLGWYPNTNSETELKINNSNEN